MASARTVVIVGAGMAGLCAARAMQAHCRVILLDKGRVAGGRVSTHIDRNNSEMRWDKGAMFFTVRDPQFAQLAEEWQQNGDAKIWTHGWGEKEDGHPRYCGVNGMNTLAQALLRNLDNDTVTVRLGTRVVSAAAGDSGWTLTTDGGEKLCADACVFTPPLPQSLDLLRAGGTILPSDALSDLQSIEYNPTITLRLLLSQPPAVPSPGAVMTPSSEVQFVCDNVQKGVGKEPTLTLHAQDDLSRSNFDLPEEDLLEKMKELAAPYIGSATVLRAHLHKWRYATPSSQHPLRCLLTYPVPSAGVDKHRLSPIVFAGDAFFHARVEGACLSGMAAAELVMKSLGVFPKM